MLCKYPRCRNKAEKTFALVDLCEKHYELISEETKSYYARKIGMYEREHYYKISSYIPWSKEYMSYDERGNYIAFRRN